MVPATFAMPLVTTVVHPTVASDLATVDAASNGKHANAPPLPTQISYTLLPTMPTQNSYVPTPALPTQSSYESPLAMSRENSYTPTVMRTWSENHLWWNIGALSR